jgi:hypothetical protein
MNHRCQKNECCVATETIDEKQKRVCYVRIRSANLNVVKIDGDESVNQSSEARCIDSIIVCDHDCASITFLYHVELFSVCVWMNERRRIR